MDCFARARNDDDQLVLNHAGETGTRQIYKSFLVLFFKKELLASVF